MIGDVAGDMGPISHNLMIKRLEQLQVEIRTQTKLTRIEDGRAIVDHQGDHIYIGKFDSVVVAVGNRPFELLSEELLKERIIVKIAGDAEKPARIYDAVASGHRVAMTI